MFKEGISGAPRLEEGKKRTRKLETTGYNLQEMILLDLSSPIGLSKTTVVTGTWHTTLHSSHISFAILQTELFSAEGTWPVSAYASPRLSSLSHLPGIHRWSGVDEPAGRASPPSQPHMSSSAILAPG